MAVNINKLITGNMGVGTSEILDLTKTRVKYTAESGLPDWEGDIVGIISGSGSRTSQRPISIDLPEDEPPVSSDPTPTDQIPNVRQAQEIEIGNTVTSIGSYAFYECSSLTSVTIPNSATSIGERAFYYCYGLTSVTIPNGVTSIGDWAFNGCSGLASVTIGNGVTSIGEEEFTRCSNLTSVTIPASVTSIGYGAFRNCGKITSLVFQGKTLAEVQAMSNYSWKIPNFYTSIIKVA